MNIADILDIATPLLVVIVGVLYTFFPQWFYKKWPPEQRAWQRKLLRIFGPAFLVCGLAWLAFQFTK
jgi:uncharacterized protein YjeT (DUF2065 family)